MRTTLGIGIVALLATGMMACNKDDNGNGTQDAATCFPTNCLAEGKNCGSIMDGCGQVIQCGTCTVPDTCGGGGTANVCGNGLCTATTCVAASATCGQLSDGCADVLDCGTCTLPAVCGGAGVANQCGVPSTTDAGTPQQDAGITGLCDASCMAQAGAVCCETCGCDGATVRCDPICESPYQWDCEMQCCFNYSNYQCQ